MLIYDWLEVTFMTYQVVQCPSFMALKSSDFSDSFFTHFDRENKVADFFLQVKYWGIILFNILVLIHRGPEMNHKCFFHLFDIAILQYICKTKRSVICGKKKYIHISYILGHYSYEIFLFFYIPKKTKIYVVIKKSSLLTKFCAIWTHIQYSSKIQDFSSLFWQVVER